MTTQYDWVVPPEIGFDETRLAAWVQQHAPKQGAWGGFRVLKRSIDARARQVKINLKVQIWWDEQPPIEEHHYPENQVQHAPEVHIVGAGPAGLFAALQCIQHGLKPVVIEMGKDVRLRRRDLAAITKEHLVNPTSNYCFGEGGAGTYSDGKLYTRSDKRGHIASVLSLFVAFGASPDIMVNARPHIGTNKLPSIISKIRDHIMACGGEVHFETAVTGIRHGADGVSALQLNAQHWIPTKHVILATGHSARGIYEMLHREQIALQLKPFALGVRAEHPQQLIDSIQYHCTLRGDYLPPAYYSVVSQVEQKGVYSFCMCPGGIIAPCATAPGEIVTNGWSPSKRNNAFANSGIVTEITVQDIIKTMKSDDVLAGIRFQHMIEKAAFNAGGGGQIAPAQRMTDFVRSKASANLPATSYQPGVHSVELGQVLPGFVADRLRKGFADFGKKMPGYLTEEALLVAVESRTSAPIRIPRDPETLEHITVKGLYPCAEGAGYAGGIVSAAIDGIKCVDKIAQHYGIATE